MSYDRRRWIAALIVALLGGIALVSALNMQVRAGEPSASAQGKNSANTSYRLSMQGIPTGTATFTRTFTPTPTATASKTPVPAFNCSLLSLSYKRLFSNQFQIDIQNLNVYDAYITRVQLVWPNIPAFAQMGLAQMTLNGTAIWNGPDPQVIGNNTTTTDTDTKPGTPPFSNTPISLRTVASFDNRSFGASFNGPPLLSTYVTANQYSIILTMNSDGNSGAPCVLSSLESPPTATPTLFAQPSATATPTPDCAPGLIAIRFDSFDNFGIVRFNILSQRNTPSTLTGFNINWQKYVNTQKLVQVSLGAPPGYTGSVVVWDSGNLNEDASPPTNSQTEGVWLTNFTIPPGAVGSPSLTPIYFDFEGIYRYDEAYGSTNPPYGGSSDFNFSEFDFTCDNVGGQPTEEVTPEVMGSPTDRVYPTNPAPPPTQMPTSTPIATSTFSPTSMLTSTWALTTTSTVTSTPTMTPTLTVTTTTTPELMTINYFTSHILTLTWTPVTWAVRYEIQISTDKDFAAAQTTSAFVPDKMLSYTTPSLSDGTYYWRVRALDANDNSSGWSKSDTFHIAFLPPPTADTSN